VQAVFELIRIEVSDNIPETLVIERDEDAPVLELRQKQSKIYCIE
jgi:hypothetical protein